MPHDIESRDAVHGGDVPKKRFPLSKSLLTFVHTPSAMANKESAEGWPLTCQCETQEEWACEDEIPEHRSYLYDDILLRCTNYIQPKIFPNASPTASGNPCAIPGARSEPVFSRRMPNNNPLNMAKSAHPHERDANPISGSYVLNA